MPESGKRAVEIADLYRFRLVSDLQLSPDGRIVAYALTRLRKEKDDYASNIWLVPSDGSREPRKFTGSSGRDTSPKWSPTGNEIAFVSTRSGSPQIWLIPTDGGEARQLTRVKRGVGEFAWSPDGRRIVFTHSADTEQDKAAAGKNRPSETEEQGRDIDSENREAGGVASPDLAAPGVPGAVWEEDYEDENAGDQADRVRVIDRVHYKADGRGFLERRQHLFLIPAKGGTPTQLTQGDWDANFPRWSPDGRSIAFLTNVEADAEYRNIIDIFTLVINDDGQPGEMQRVTQHDSALMGFDWLPSGHGFAAFGHRRLDEAALATNPEVWAISMDGQVHSLTQGFDRPAGSWMSSDMRSTTGEFRPRFSPDGRTIFFIATNEGNVGVYSVPVVGGPIKQVIGGARQVLNFSVGGESIVFSASNPSNPNDIFIADLSGAGERKLTNLNEVVLSELQLSEPREFWMERPGGARVQGWIMLPRSHRDGEKHPMVLQIHGGPHMSFGNVYFHEFQVMAGGGYAVLYANPQGSQGYGQAFSDAIINDWGGVDYEDLMACVDYCVGQGYVDEKRMGVAGGSYGGYMSAWIVSHTNRFAAAVASRLVANLYSAWGTGDFTWQLWNWELEGDPRGRTSLYLERSPVTHAANIETPLLLTHAEDDLRTSIEQAEQMYMALKVLKREVKMVLFPSGGHEVSRSGKPSLRVERMKHIIDWFDKFLKEDPERV